MTPARFTDLNAAPDNDSPPTTNTAFFLVAMPGVNAAPQTTMQWFYQRLYEQAAGANQPAPMRDLFKVMN